MSISFRALRKSPPGGGGHQPGAGARSLRIPVIGALILALSVPGALTPVATAADALGRPDVPKPRVSQVKAITTPGTKSAAARARVAKSKAANKKQATQARRERAAAWPKASTESQKITAKPVGTGLVDITSVASAKTSAKTGRTKGQGPLAGGTATVNLLDQKAARRAGVTGVLFTAQAQTPGAAQVTVDYSTFASAVGGNWSGRLGLVSLPACALTTPQKAKCRKQTPLKSRNNVSDQTVAAQADLAAKQAEKPASRKAERTTAGSSAAPATVFAVTATSSSSVMGDPKATPLSASSTWEAGGSSGAFTWSYPIALPPAAAGPVPSLSLAYNSGSIDGRTANTNNQGSQVGEGFDLTSSYIERTYGSCDDDGQTGKHDLCWKYENASLVLNGKATELVKDDTSKVWRLKDDDASKVTHRTGADNGDDGDDITNGNGDGKGEYWEVVTGDGTTYTFGLNKLPGATTERTGSVWTAPVFGDDSGEPGYSSGSSFSGRAKTQAWRWNLDLVTDVHGNASTYWYKREGNNYAKNGDKTALALYTRGGHLLEIKYGQRADSLFTGRPSGTASLSYAERCFATDCSSLTAATADNWPDVPFDAICSASETNCLGTGPAFFTRKRLTGIDTSVWSTALEPDAYKPVDNYKLTQEYLDGQDIGNSSDQTLVLKSLQRTGKNGTAITLPPVDFTYHMRPNRVDSPSDDILPLSRPRINTVTSEAGAITTVTLSGPECVRGTKMPTAEDDNSLSCYPVYWAINGGEPALDWFHKYNVTAVSTSDPAGLNDAVENSYTYEGPAWHYNDDPMTPEKQRTWSIWRGYRKVTTYTGDTSHTQSKTVRLFMQGMHGDKRKDGTTRIAVTQSIDLPGLDFGDANDLEPYAGFLREEITYNGTQAVAVTFNSIWYKQTASQQQSYANTKAYFVRTARTYVNTYLTASDTWRRTSTGYTYDGYGMTTRVDAAGDTAKTGDETCTRTWYARDADKGLTSLVSRTRVIGSACLDSTGAVITDDKLNLPGSSASRGDVLSDTAVVYDNTAATGWSATQVPTLGLVTWAGRAKAYPAPIGTSDRHPALTDGWQTTAAVTYDTATAKLGRALTVTDADGNITSTTYYPASTGPVTTTVVAAPTLASNNQQHKNYTYVDPARGSVTSTLDANLKKTENTYDALGRITGTWLPNRHMTSSIPTVKYDYHLARGSQPWTSVSTIKADGTTYQTGYAIADALLRPLQSQTPSVLGGRVLTDTRYDSRGLAYETYADIYDTTSGPNGTYARASYANTPALTATAYDGAGRATTSSLTVFGTKKWETSSSYTGDSVATTAVAGGTASRTITDALGRTTETRTYAGTSPADTAYGATAGSAYTSVKYDYTRDGKQTQITGPDNAKWTYTYDLFGRQTSNTDPDKGITATSYTALDQIATTEDADKNILAYGYDELGRKTGLWKTSKTDANKLAAWTYDTLLKGMPDASTRYEGGTTGKAYTKKITAYDTLNRATSTDLVLPSDDPLVTSGAVTATTTFGTAYKLDGSINNTKEPAAAGLTAEIIQPEYNSHGLPIGLSGTSGYLLGVDYSALGQVHQMTLGTSTAEGVKKAYVSNNFEAGTGRLLRSFVTDQTHPWMPQDLNYAYDQAGNVTSIFDPATLGGTAEADYQCFAYDGQRRLTEAWTPKTADCAAAGRTTTNLDGAAPYWTSYTYNTAGQRASERQRSGTDTTTTYCYSSARPHALTAATTAASCTGVAEQYTYDASGNTTKRAEKAGSTASQTLGWNPEGKLSKLTENATATDYLYDAEGELLIRRKAGGETVLYLGATEVHMEGTKKWANRYYNVAGATIALRSNETGTSKVTWLAADRHGTSSLALDAGTQAISKRYNTPFGSSRGTPTGTWPDDKAFLGKPADTDTGLTHVGAREYDPTTGQFISVDPLLELDKHQTLNGYTYGAQNPTTFSDPTGREIGSKPDSCQYDIKYCTPEEAGTSGKGKGEASGTSSTTSTGEVDDLGDGKPGLPPKEDVKLYFSSGKYPTVGQMQYLGTYIAEMSYELNVELYLRDRCGREGMPQGCSEFRKFYDGWKHVDSIDTVDKCPLCSNPGFALVLSRIGGRGKLGNCTRCFLAGTEVRMGDGSDKDIEDVQVGDEVLATDPETGVTGKRRVTHLIVTEHDKYFNELTIATDDGLEKLTATHEHPFWSPSEHRWVGAGELKPGMTLLTDDGDTVIVTGNRPFAKHAKTYNLTVDDLHTYYVLAGETPVLVHNSGPCDPPLKSLHPDSSLDKSSLDFWNKQDTDDIVFSLRRGAHEPLIAKPDGTIMNGNTRVAVLRSRGYDVDSLPRESYGGGRRMTDEDFWDMDQ